MNIFKVLASGKKSFQEETASAILAWFLNPTMEHGLGYTFVSKFIDAIFSSADNENKFTELSKKLVPRLRNTNGNQNPFWIDLEYKVDNADIDIVFGIDESIFAIENKIYSSSATKGQLVREYEGLKKEASDSIVGMIYLVPIAENSEIFDAKTENMFNELSIKNNDFKVMVTWQKNNIGNIPSIADLIEQTLDDESKGKMDPIPEYTRHTLKALNSFISNNFSGYEYDKKKTSSGSVNPLTEKRLSLNEITKLNKGFVGVNYDIRGLIRMTRDEIKKYEFQYTSQEMTNKRNWIEITKFKAITNWLINQTLEDINWEGSFPSESLYNIARDYKGNVFIGIKGGEEALRKMDPQVIKSKEWGISTEQSKQSKSQWVDGVSYSTILKEKGLYQ